MKKDSFVCPTCGYEDREPGNCPDCSMELEEVCGKCGNSKSECVCDNVQEEEEEDKEKEN